MSAAAVKTFKLGILGTDWALTQFGADGPCAVTTYKTGHHFQGEKEAKEKGTRWRKLVELGTGWALTQFETCDPSGVTTYETGRCIQREKGAQENDC